MRITRIVLLALALPVVTLGCTIRQAVSKNATVPVETRTRCESHCTKLGMRLSAVVLIMSSAGCVCEPNRPRTEGRTGSTAVAGGALIHAAIEAQRRAQAAQQQRQSYYHR